MWLRASTMVTTQDDDLQARYPLLKYVDILMKPCYSLLLRSTNPKGEGGDDSRRLIAQPCQYDGAVKEDATPRSSTGDLEYNFEDFKWEYPVINPLLFSALFSLFAAMGGFLGGYDTGIISGAMVYLKDEYKFSDVETEMIVSGVVGGAIFGSLMSGSLSDIYGRKFVSFFSAFTYMIGGVFMCSARGFISLFFGRLVTGFAVGCGSIAPIYIGEVVPSQYRGAFVNSNALLIATGQLVSYLAAYNLSGNYRPSGKGDGELEEVGNWRLMLGLTIIPPIIQFILMPFMPQSPRYLSSRGRIKDAAKSLLLIYPSNMSKEEIIGRITSIKKNALLSTNMKGKQQSYTQIFMEKKYRTLIFITSGLQILQQLSGINTIMYYSAIILKMAGFPSKSLSILFSALIGLSNSLGSLISMYTVTKFGRRSLLLVTLPCVFLGLLNLSLTFSKSIVNTSAETVPADTKVSKSSYIALSSVILYVLFYALGLGCVPWNILAEIFPIEIRSKGAGLAIASNWVTNFLVSSTFLTLTSFIGASGTFLLYSLSIAIGWVLIYLFVPETKGKSLEANINEGGEGEDIPITLVH